MERTWVQGSLDNGSYWELNHTPNHIVTAFEFEDDYQWAVVDPSDESVVKEGTATSLENAQREAISFYDTHVVKSPWHFDREIQAYTSEGDMPEFRCSCGNKIALAGMTTCANCDEQWISWSVNNNNEKSSKNFVRTIMKRDGVVLAATRDESPEFDDDDNEIEDYTSVPAEDTPSVVEDDTDEDTQQILRKQKYTSVDEEFTAGYVYAEVHSSLPDEFTDEFKVGFIASLEDRINDLKN